jgi:hypothetical protein
MNWISLSQSTDKWWAFLTFAPYKGYDIPSQGARSSVVIIIIIIIIIITGGVRLSP